MHGTPLARPMKKKPSTPLRPKRSRLVSASNECPAEPGAVLGSPPNSETVPESASQIRYLTISQHSHNLLKFLNEDRARRKFCDVSVSVGGKLYSAHKVVLAHGSSYFHAELSKNPATTHVTLDHVEDSVFQYLLGFLYTSECAVAERDLPALTEAARFLDMMDILKLLCEEGDTHPANVMKAEIRRSPEVEITSSHLAAGDTDIQSLWDVQSTVCSQQFSTENSLHTDVQQESSAEKERMEGQKSVTTRRSARRRKTPTKYQRDNMEYTVNTTEEKQRTMSPKEQIEDRVEEVGEVVVETQMAKLDVNETSKPAQGDDVADEEEEGEGGDMNEEVATQQKVVEVCVIDKSAGQQSSSVDSTEHRPVGEVGVHANQQRVYPAGLAPVIIQTSSKKTLKCPKCDKTFDRAGENHGVKSTIMLNTTIVSVNFLGLLTVIKNTSYMIGGIGLQLTLIVNLLL